MKDGFPLSSYFTYIHYSPTKTKPRATAAKETTAMAIEDQGTSASRQAVAPKGRVQNASQVTSQGSSQTHSRLVASIGSRKKKLF